MIIDCIKCNKKFEVNSDLIPSEGRTIQCGSCNHVWFFKKNFLNKSKKTKKENPKSRSSLSYNDKIEIDETENIKKDIKVIKKKHELTKYQPKSYFSFSKFLSYILVIIISFIALIIILDTFKSPLYKFFPNLEFLLFNLFETFKDIILFIEDLF